MDSPGCTYVTNIYIGGDGPCPSPIVGHFNYSVGRPISKGESDMLEVTCTNEEKIRISVNPVTPGGAPATLDGPIALEVQSGEGTFELIDDASFYVISGDLPGDTVFVVTGDADLGEGVVNISDIVTLHVEGAMAASFGLVADAPELK